MEPLLAVVFLLSLVALGLLIWWLDHRRARRARVESADPARKHRLSSDELRARLVEFCQAHPALDVHQEHGHLTVTWILPSVHQDEEPPPDRTYSLELRLREPGTVNVLYGEGKVAWCHTDAGHAYDPAVEWERDMTPDFGDFLLPGAPVPDPTDHSPHTVDGLVIPLRKIVLDAGWAWQPVLELPIEERLRQWGVARPEGR